MKKSLPELYEQVQATYYEQKEKNWPLACEDVYFKYDVGTVYTEKEFKSEMGKKISAFKQLSNATVKEIKASTQKVVEVLKPKQKVEQIDLFQSGARRGGFSTT